MSLKSISLSNFKSYRGTASVSFDETPFVSIVGPNGSGKSNLLDAICFVVGLSAEKLRCNSLKELINKGSDGGMYVSALIRSQSQEQSQDIEFKRTPNSYQIDGKDVGEDEYTAKWSELHVLPSGKNSIVLQGDIEKLAGAESQELASFIESMNDSTSPSDIDSYNRVEEELNDAVTSTRKITQSGRAALAEADHNMKLGEAKAKLEDLQLQLRKCEKRKESLVQREQLAVLNGIRKEIRSAKEHLEACLEEQRLAEADSKKLRSEFAKKRRVLQSSRNAETEVKEAVARNEAQLEPLVKRIESLETELRLLAPEIEFGEQSVEAAESEIKSANDSINLLQREFQRDKSRDLTASSGGQADLSPELKAMWSQLDTEFVSETVMLQDDTRSHKREAEKLHIQLGQYERQSEDLHAELNSMNAKEMNSQQRIRHLESLISERTAQQDQRRKELSKVADELMATQVDQKEYRDKLKELDSKIKKANVGKQALSQRHKLLDAVDRLKRGYPGVYDILGNLVEAIEPKFQNALERGIGSFHMDTIIVDTMETAAACINQAKSDRLGRLHIMPLSGLSPKDLAASRALVARQVAQGYDIRLLIDCAKFDPRFRPAILSVLVDSAYVSSFEDGLKLRKAGLSMKLVTETGSVISTSNIISSMSASSLVSGSSQRHLALMQRNLINTSEKLRVSEAREVELTDSEVRLNAELNRTISTIEGAQDELIDAREQLSSIQKSVEHQQRVIKSHEVELTKIADLFEQSEAVLKSHLDKINVLRAEKFAGFLARAGGTIEKWDGLFSKGAQRLNELSRQGQRLNDRLQLATEKHIAANTQLSKHKERAKLLESALQEYTVKKDTIDAELAHNSQKLVHIRSRLNTARTEAEEKSDEVGMAEGSVDAARLRVTEAERETNKYKVALATQLGENPNDKDADGESSDEDYNDVDIDEITQISDSDEEDEESPENNASASNAKRKRKRNAAKATKLDQQSLSIDRLDGRISKLKSEIEILVRLVGLEGTEDNEKALHASQLYEELNQSADSARAKQDALSTQLEQLRKKRSTSFMRVFHVLQLSLTTVYSGLVGEDAQARLTVIDSDKPFEGVEFTVMPPGKPFTPVSRLSGGERSMAALALLFASQNLTPAPFIVLDEVDAALDFANVSNLSKYINTHSHETQFIAVSLKQRLFQTASNLVGVYKQKADTKILTVTL